MKDNLFRTIIFCCISVFSMQLAFGQDILMTKEQPGFVQSELAIIKDRLNSSQPVRLLKPTAPSMALAEQIVANSNQLAPFIKDLNGSIMRVEVFGVFKALPSDKSADIASKCPDGSCYKVELYNFSINTAITTLVNTQTKEVVKMISIKNTQPDIPSYLKDLAIKIAVESKTIEKALGYKPNSTQAQMAGTKTSLNKSRCERSLHLCVAPTFVQGDKALWSIVDLTEMKLVGIRWTKVGESEARPGFTERKLQNEYITNCFCEKESKVEKNQWKLNYQLTSSDGLKISKVEFGDKKILDQAKLVDWHVSYSNTDGFGYSDAVGCPFFSTAAVVAIDPPEVLELKEGNEIVGFVLQQSFFSEGWPAACNYNYVQRYEFYNDGRFRISAASVGRGCGNNGTYRPVFRIAFASEMQQFHEYTQGGWNKWESEKWQLQNEATIYSPEKFQYKISLNTKLKFGVEPGQGQFNDGGRGDNAYMYVTVAHREIDEGDTDLMTIGPCCNQDYQQGPEKFVNSEPLRDGKLVLWYSAMMKNDDRPGKEYCWAKGFLEDGVFKTLSFPCFVGPMFIPLP